MSALEIATDSSSESTDSDSDTEEPSPKRSRCDREPSTSLEGSDNPSTSTVPSLNEPNPEVSHDGSETPGNNQLSSEPVEDQSDPNADNNRSSEVQESHNGSETPGNVQPSSEPVVEDQNDPNADNNPIDVNIKLIHLLPPQVAAQKLLVTVDLSKVLEDYFNRAIENCRLTAKVTVDKLDLTLPSSYGSKLQDNTDLLTRILAKIMTKTCQLKVPKVVFPEMRIDLLKVVMCGLENEFCEKKSPRFHEIKLQFSAKDQKISHDDLVHVVDPLLVYKPKEICLHTNDSVESNAALKKKLEDVIQKKVTEEVEKPKVRLNSKLIVSYKSDKKKEKEKKVKKPPADKKSNTKKKRGSVAEPSSKAKIAIPKNLGLQDPQSQVFAFDFHLMVPYSPGSSNFTAYKYWNLEKIHSKGFTGKGVTVAIVDSGISPHYAFGNTSKAYNFTGDVINIDMVGHGTICAGILCGKPFDYYPDPQNELVSEINIFPSGVAPDANLVVCKVTSGASNTATSFAVANALRWIGKNNKEQQKRIDVVSLSMGSLGISLDVVDAINDLVSNGVIIVCAASNYGRQYSQPICFPARLGHVLCIGSHGPHGKPSSFSPVGQDIDFLAPGECVAAPNSMIANHVAVDSGTSYAAPAVAGLVCLILEYINRIGISNLPHSVQVAKQYKNHWVMKEILRKISTCPGRHTDDEGFGALNPLYFFQQPDQIIKMINDEVVNPVFMELSQQYFH